MRNQIIKEAEDYKEAFYEKRKLNCETNKANNREREKVGTRNSKVNSHLPLLSNSLLLFSAPCIHCAYICV